MPKERYRLYHAEKAKGGIALTMIGGSSVVSPDSPQAFGNITLYKDEVVPWLRELADAVHEHGAAVMIQITHLGRRTSWSKGDWLPVVAPSPDPRARAPRLSEVRRGLGHRAHRGPIRGRGRALPGGGPRRPRDRMLRPPRRPVLVAGHQQARGRLRRLAGEPPALHHARCCRRCAARVGGGFLVGVRMVCDEDWEKGLTRRGRRRRSPGGWSRAASSTSST